MNSVDDIIRDRVVLYRERNLDVRLGSYVAAKFGTLVLFSAVQCALFILVGNYILEISGMFWPYFIFMLITAASGTSLGLLISALVADSKTAANFVPLVLIPQLIFGGALIKYEDMNKDLDAIYSIKRWISTHPREIAHPREDEKLTIPLISRFVATHYSYEALIVAQARLNPLAARQDLLQDQIDRNVSILQHDKMLFSWLKEGVVSVKKLPTSQAERAPLVDRLKRDIETIDAKDERSENEVELRKEVVVLQKVLESNSPVKIDGWLKDAGGKITKMAERDSGLSARLEDLKDTLALLSGLESGSEAEIARRMKRVDKIIDGGPLDAAGLRSRTTGFTAERLFTNQKVNDLVSKAETEQNDYRRTDEKGRPQLVNVFFGPQKRALGVTLSVFASNALVLIGTSLFQLVILYALLRRQLRTRGI